MFVRGRSHSSCFRRSWNLRSSTCLASFDVGDRRSRRNSKTPRSFDLSIPVLQVTPGDARDRTRRGDASRSSRHTVRLGSFHCAQVLANHVNRPRARDRTDGAGRTLSVSFHLRSRAIARRKHGTTVVDRTGARATDRERRIQSCTSEAGVSDSVAASIFRAMAPRSFRPCCNSRVLAPSKARGGAISTPLPTPRGRRRSRDDHVTSTWRFGFSATSASPPRSRGRRSGEDRRCNRSTGCNFAHVPSVGMDRRRCQVRVMDASGAREGLSCACSSGAKAMRRERPGRLQVRQPDRTCSFRNAPARRAWESGTHSPRCVQEHVRRYWRSTASAARGCNCDARCKARASSQLHPASIPLVRRPHVDEMEPPLAATLPTGVFTASGVPSTSVYHSRRIRRTFAATNLANFDA